MISTGRLTIQFICSLVDLRNMQQIAASTIKGTSMIHIYLKLSAKPCLRGNMEAAMISGVTPGTASSAAALPDDSAGLSRTCQL